MDAESAAWLSALAGVSSPRATALIELHYLLLKVAMHEAHRRGPMFRVGGPELDDLAHQAADDAMIALLGKLHTFRGDSRFTTWAYRFVVLEVANKLGRHRSRQLCAALDSQQWERLPDRLGPDPLAHAQQRELIDAVRQAIDELLTDHQRRFFIAIVVNAVPMEVVAAQTGRRRGAIYKAVFDARRKIRAHLKANGYLDGAEDSLRPREQRAEADDRDDGVVETGSTVSGRRPA